MQNEGVAAGNEDDVANDILWGVPAIARFLNRKPRQVHYLISKKIIPITKRGHKIITASRAQIRALFKPPHN
jgi:hypothetical protein